MSTQRWAAGHTKQDITNAGIAMLNDIADYLHDKMNTREHFTKDS